MRGTGEAGSLHSRIQNRKGRASALRTRGKRGIGISTISGLPEGPPGRPWTPPRTPQAFVAAGATIFISATYFTIALATRQFLDLLRDPWAFLDPSQDTPGICSCWGDDFCLGDLFYNCSGNSTISGPPKRPPGRSGTPFRTPWVFVAARRLILLL